MAQMKKQVLGSVSGALKDIVFRERYGKNYAAMRPASFKTPEDPASVGRRSKFKMAVELSKAINQSAELKSLWKPDTPTGLSPYNFIVKTNYFRVTADAPGNNVLLVPSGGFPISAVSVDIAAAQVKVKLEAIGTNNGIDPLIETKLRMFSVLYNSNPSVPDNLPYSYITLGSDEVNTDLGVQLDFTSPLDGTEQYDYNQYQDHKVYFVLVTLNAEGQVVHYSITLNG